MGKKSRRRKANRIALFERLEHRHLLAADPFGTNPLQPLDVSRDGRVTALDALRVINALNREEDGDGRVDPADNIGSFIDVTGEGDVTALDALRVINALNGDAPVIAATLPNDSGPAGRDDLAHDLRTNEYAIDLTISISELGERTVELSIGGESSVPVDITNRFSTGRATLSQEQVDELAGGPLPDGDHHFEVSLGGGNSKIEFVLTIDRSAPDLSLVTPIQGGEHSETARILGSISDANIGGPVIVALNDQAARALSVDESGQLDQRIATELLPGLHQLTVIATDAVGNTVSQQVDFEVSDQFLVGTDDTEGWIVRGSDTLRLGEQNSFVVQAEMPIDVGAEGNRTLSFDVVPQFDTSDDVSILEDQFLVYLVDPTDPTSTLLDQGDSGTPLFSLNAQGQADFPSGVVRFNGTRLDVDLSRLPAGQGLLRFQMIGSDQDTGSLVAVSNFTNEVDPEGVASPQFTGQSQRAATGQPLAFSGLTVDEQINVVVGAPALDTTTGKYSADLRVSSDQGIDSRQVAVVLSNLPDGVQLENVSGIDSDSNPYIAFQNAIGPGGLAAGVLSEPVRITFDNPELLRMPIDASVLVGQPNQAPTLEAIEPISLIAGEMLSVPLSATDPNGDQVTYGLSSADEMPTTTLLPDGTLTLAPTPEQVGTYEFTVSASDGALKSQQTVSVTVAADPVTTTRVSGRVLDVDGSPLQGMQIELGAVQGLTDSDGFFTLDLGSGPLVSDTLRVRGDTFPGEDVYPFIAEKLPLVLEHEVFEGALNTVHRPIYLPKLDVAGGTAINPMVDTTLTQEIAPGETATVSIAASSLMNQQGTPFDGVLSITEVPPSLTPAALPENLVPDTVVTIQPGEMVFSQPAPLTLPNRAGWEPGTVMDLWSINPVTGQFEIVGVTRVSGDGSVFETIEGGIRNSSWHFVAPPPPSPKDPRENDRNESDGCEDCKDTTSVNSLFETHSGAMLERHDLATYQSVGQTRGVSLVYDSKRADPRPIVHFGYSNVDQTEDRRLVARLEFTRGDFNFLVPGASQEVSGLSGGEHFFRLSPVDGEVDAALQADFSDLPSGLYQYSLQTGILRLSEDRLTGTMVDSGGDFLHVNSIGSPVGHGWGISGTQQIIENPNGSLLLMDGNGSELLFEADVSLDDAFVSPGGDFTTMQRLPDGTFRRTTKDRTVFQFDADNRLASITDRHGNATRYVYDGGLLQKIIDPASLETLFRYTNGLLTEIEDPAGRITRLEHDTAGNLTRIVDPDVTSRTFFYDVNRNMTGEINQRGLSEQTYFGFHGRVTGGERKDGSVMQIAPAQTQGLFRPEATMDLLNAPVATRLGEAFADVADGNGNVMTTVLDQAGQAVSKQDAAGRLSSVERNVNNLVAQSGNGRGYQTEFTHDGLGNVLSISDAAIRREQPGPLFSGQLFSMGGVFEEVTTVDVNADGVTDLVTANRESDDVSVLLGNGDGTFAAHLVFGVGDAPKSVTTGDLNGDGVTDLITANRDSDDVSVLLGNGDGTFAPHMVFGVGDGPWSVTTGDLNGDGVTDLITANRDSDDVSVLLGNGDGTFLSQQRFDVGIYPLSVTTGDFNGDGQTDLATGNASDDGVSVLLGNGDGSFGSVTRLGGGSSRSVTTGDFNGDGATDLVTPNIFGDAVSVRLGNGDGTFASQLVVGVGDSPVHVTTGDFNSDGITDLVTANSYRLTHETSYAGNVSVLLGNGDGTFLSERRYDVGEGPIWVTTGDINGDGVTDLLSSTISDDNDFFALSVLLGNGNGSFASLQRLGGGEYVRSVTGEYAWSVTPGDFNGDGLTDLAIPTIGSTSGSDNSDVSVLLSNGNGTFGAPQRFGVGKEPRSIKTGDFDGDGVADLVTANRQSNDVSVLLGNGDGSFASESRFGAGFLPQSIATADFNGDGATDLVVANDSVDVSVLLGNGDGSFASELRFDIGAYPRSVATGDFNGDGVTDLVTANHDSDDMSILLGNGDGTFASRIVFGVGDRPWSVTTGDLNGDGVIDLITANRDSDDVSVLLGNGDGTFPSQQRFAVGLGPWSVTTGDFNSDGVSDLITANRDSFDVSVLLGNGDGTFASQQRFVAGFAYAVIAGDFNGDGSTDLATSDFSVLLNTGGLNNSIGVYPRMFSYDPTFNQLTSSTDELGRQTLLEIDPSNGNTLSMTEVVRLPDSESGESDDLVTQYTYTTFDLVDTVTDPLGRVTDYDYDAVGRVTSVTYAVGTPDEATMGYEYDDAGNQTAMIDGNGNRTEYEFDELNRLTKMIEADPDGDGPLVSPVTVFSYDAAGNLESTTDAKGRVSTSAFDDLNRLIESIGPDPDGDGPLLAPVTSFTYDPAGNFESSTDPNGNRTSYTYDSRNRRIEMVDPDGGVTKFSYDADDNLSRVIDPVGNVTQFRYDARNRLVEEVDPLGNSILYAYDAADNLIEKTDRNERVTKYTYDDIDRLIKEEWVAVNEEVVNTIDYSYDAAGNLLSVADAVSALAYTYDARDRVKTVDNAGTPDAPNVVLTYDYDDNNNVLTVADTIEAAVGASTTYQYDALDRLIVLGQSGNEVTDKRVNFTYNPLGQYSAIDRYRDLPGNQLVIGTDYSYDGQNRLTRIDHQNSSGSSVAFYDYKYDVASRITKITDVDGATNYEYDDRDQLISADNVDAAFTDELYQYDANGNRVESSLHGTGYETGPANRLLSDGTYNYEYDDEGNMVRRTEIATGEVRELAWDHRHRLTAITELAADDSLTQRVEFRYDALNRRISKSVDDLTDSVDADISQFVYDREDVILDFDDGDGPAEPQLVRRYLHGPGIDHVFAQEDGTDNVQWLLDDQIGTVRDLVNNLGVVMNHLNYDSFGNVIEMTNDTINTHYLFQSRRFDEETGLQYFRSRYYSPESGRFISEDTIRFGSDSPNLYQFLGGDPVSQIDPFGTRPFLPPRLGPGATPEWIQEFLNTTAKDLAMVLADDVSPFDVPGLNNRRNEIAGLIVGINEAIPILEKAIRDIQDWMRFHCLDDELYDRMLDSLNMLRDKLRDVRALKGQIELQLQFINDQLTDLAGDPNILSS